MNGKKSFIKPMLYQGISESRGSGKIRTLIILPLFFYCLALFQISFLPHFSFWGINLPAVIAGVFILNIWESADFFGGVWAAMIAGLFLDIFSQGFLGAWALGFLLFALLLKTIKRIYVRVPIR